MKEMSQREKHKKKLLGEADQYFAGGVPIDPVQNTAHRLQPRSTSGVILPTCYLEEEKTPAYHQAQTNWYKFSFFTIFAAYGRSNHTVYLAGPPVGPMKVQKYTIVNFMIVPEVKVSSANAEHRRLIFSVMTVAERVAVPTLV